MTLLNDLIDKAKLVSNDMKYRDKRERDTFYQSRSWRKKRATIVARDNGECQVCKSEGGVTLSPLIVHHILTLEYHSRLAMDDSNLITVCHQHHNEIHELTKKKYDDEWY